VSCTVASYRAGYLAEDRSVLERALAEGVLRGVATTNALEFGVDIAGQDAVVRSDFPARQRLSSWAPTPLRRDQTTIR
jgi:DEAD/DEAH box helicase domain-containing protein